MSKRHILGTAKVEEEHSGAHRPHVPETDRLTYEPENGWIKRYYRNFHQLEWHDKLNVILAATLGLGLVLVLSPLLLVSWICLQLATRSAGIKRSASLEIKSPQPKL
jgi:hypothetical protein